MRVEFEKSMELICEKVTDNAGESPLLITIRALTQNLPRSDSTIDTSMCSEFFTLFGSLIKLYQARVTENPALADTA